MARKNKIRQQQLQAAHEKDAFVNDVLRFSRTRFKRFDEVILQVYLEKDLQAFHSDRRIAVVDECFANVPAKTRPVERVFLKDVFVHLHRCSALFSAEETIRAVYNMTKFHERWNRDLFAWRPCTNRAGLQLNELAHYLFCSYPVPAFLYKALHEKSNMTYLKWFIHVGTGKRLKELEKMPIPFLQKTGHYFLQAPEKFSIPSALRWAQVKGLGGDDRLAERIAYSWLAAKPFDDEPFWDTFVRILVQGRMTGFDHLTELIDYVREARRQNSSYTLKGRTLQSLTRQSEEWHQHVMNIKGNQTWALSGITGYSVERREDVLAIEELTGSKLLTEEGRLMKHCVATYVHECMKGRSAIFSLRRYVFEQLDERLATIEVNISMRRVVQAKAKHNGRISEEAMKHLQAWAKTNELTLSPYL